VTQHRYRAWDITKESRTSHGSHACFPPNRDRRLLALAAIELRIEGEVTKLGRPRGADPVGRPCATESRPHDRDAAASHSTGPRTARPGCERPSAGCGGEAAVFGKADPFEMPQSVRSKWGESCRVYHLPFSGVTPEIADLLEEATDRDEGIVEEASASWSSIQAGGGGGRVF